MNIKLQYIGCYTIIRRELVRMFRIATQAFLPTVVTTLLYFLIFGTVVGNRIGSIQGVSYQEFIAPGLIVMSVITNSYANVASSLFSLRFQKSIEEVLISPLHPSVLLFGYVLGGILRGVIVAILVYGVAAFFVPLHYQHIPHMLGIVILVSALFSLAGFTNGILARTFDDVAFIPSFVLAPLTYLGGVFYSTAMLPPFWQTISHFNPMLYMVNALRQVLIGQQEVNMSLAITIILILVVTIASWNVHLLKKGTGLRE